MDVFTAILAVLKAGGAYVAVDTRYPDARRDAMIQGSGARIVITSPGWREKLASREVEVLDVNQAPAPEGASVAATPPASGDLACVLFTSGSSGAPKAIMLEHRNLIYLACNPTLVPLQPSDRFGQVSSLSFDAFHVETSTLESSGRSPTWTVPSTPESDPRTLLTMRWRAVTVTEE